MRFFGWVVLGGLLALGACAATRRYGERDGEHWSRRHAFSLLDRALDRVDATEEQRRKAHEILGRTLTELEPWEDAGRRLHDEIHAAWDADAPDAAALRARVDEQIEALRTLAHGLIDDGVALHDVLTPEQRRRLARHAGRRHRHHPFADRWS